MTYDISIGGRPDAPGPNYVSETVWNYYDGPLLGVTRNTEDDTYLLFHCLDPLGAATLYLYTPITEDMYLWAEDSPMDGGIYHWAVEWTKQQSHHVLAIVGGPMYTIVNTRTVYHWGDYREHVVDMCTELTDNIAHMTDLRNEYLGEIND